MGPADGAVRVTGQVFASLLDLVQDPRGFASGKWAPQPGDVGQTPPRLLGQTALGPGDHKREEQH